MIFWAFIVIAVALAVYGMIMGRWLTKNSIKFEKEANRGRYHGLKSRGMWPISVFALFIVPLVVACSGYRFHISSDRMLIVLMISLLPGCLFYFVCHVYYRFVTKV